MVERNTRSLDFANQFASANRFAALGMTVLFYVKMLPSTPGIHISLNIWADCEF